MPGWKCCRMLCGSNNRHEIPAQCRQWTRQVKSRFQSGHQKTRCHKPPRKNGDIQQRQRRGAQQCQQQRSAYPIRKFSGAARMCGCQHQRVPPGRVKTIHPKKDCLVKAPPVINRQVRCIHDCFRSSQCARNAIAQKTRPPAAEMPATPNNQTRPVNIVTDATLIAICSSVSA